MITLSNSEELITFTDEHGEVIYDIDKTVLGSTILLPSRLLNGIKVNFHVFILFEKAWMTKELMLQLCEIIRLEAPGNRVYWATVLDFIDEWESNREILTIP